MVYFAGLGPVKEGTPMNLYCISGGLGRRVERRGSFGAFTFLPVPTLAILPEGAALGSDALGCGVAPLALTGAAGTGFTAVGFVAAGFTTATAFSGWALAANFAGAAALAPFVATLANSAFGLDLRTPFLGATSAWAELALPLRRRAPPFFFLDVFSGAGA